MSCKTALDFISKDCTGHTVQYYLSRGASGAITIKVFALDQKKKNNIYDQINKIYITACVKDSKT